MSIDTSPAALRKLAEEYLGYYEDTNVMGATLLAIAAEKEAQQKPYAEFEAMDAVAQEFAHRLAMHLECLLLESSPSSRFYDESMGTLGAYRSAMNEIHERESPTFMGEPVLRKNGLGGE